MRKTRTQITPGVLIVITETITNIIEGLLGLRFVLKLFGASTNAPFVRWVYETTSSLISPFSGMFPSPQLTGGLLIDFSTLFAMIFYVFICFVITETLDTLIYYTSQRVIKE